MDKKALAAKVAIVTGASAGIGWATALELAAEGAAVVIQARRKERLEKLAKEIEAVGGKARVVVGDAGNPDDIHALVHTAIEWGKRLDIVIVNAGRGLAGGLLSSDKEKWDEMYRLNVLGATRLMRLAAEHMVKQKGGDIVVLGSVAGHHISPFSGFYGSSKFAIATAAEALRREICSHGVRVTTIKPAIVISEFQDVAGYDKETFGKTMQRFGKLLEPKDVARTICFVLAQQPHVHINELIIRPVGQDYP